MEFESNLRGHVVFLGGSITEMDGYRPMVCQSLQHRFPNTSFEFTNAGIASTCSTTGAFRLDEDVLQKGPVDLLLVEFAVNDDQDAGHSYADCIRGVEGIVRHVRTHNPQADILMTFFVNPSMLQALQQGQTPLSIQAHRDVARRYGIPTIHLAKEVAEKVSAGSLTWETYGGTHPKEPGNRMCTEMIDRLLDQAWSEDTSNGAREGKTVLPAPLDEYNYDQGRFIAVEQADTDAHWRTAIPDWQNIRGAKRERFTNVPMLVADRPGAELSLSFVGKAVGIYLVAGPDAGMVEASVDGGPFTRYDLLHHFSKGLHYPRSVMFANQLDSNKHVLRIRVVQPESSECGTAVRIMKFVAN